MKFKDVIEGTVVVFELSGKIMGGDPTDLMLERVREIIKGDVRNIVFDMKDVQWINSIGLGMVITSMTTVRNKGGRFALCNIGSIKGMLELTRLILAFSIYDSRQAAVDALS